MSKMNSRQRAISDYEFVRNKGKVQFVVQLHEGRLCVNVARIGVMYPFVRFVLGNEVLKSEGSEVGGLYPKWNQFFSFGVNFLKVLEVVVSDKSLLFGETEIGRISIHLPDVLQGRHTEWWDIISPTGQLAGAIFLTFEFPQSNSGPLHSSKNSWDLKMHHHIGSSPIATRTKSKNLTQISNLTPNIKSQNSISGLLLTETLDSEDLESGRTALIEKQERFKNQELLYLNNLGKLRKESALIRNEKYEIKKNNEILQVKEEDILKEKESLKKERVDIDEEKEAVMRQLEVLNEEYLRLKREKLKTRAKKKAQESWKREVDKKLGKISRQVRVRGCFETN